MSNGQTVYLPVYTYVYVEGRAMTFPVTPTLSCAIRTLQIPSPSFRPNTIVRRANWSAITWKSQSSSDPLSSVKYLVKETDFKESGGPCFIITWKADREVNAPIIHLHYDRQQRAAGHFFRE